ncbi:DUF3558 domain-containing protein [Amycolatopsis acidiphila]|uniref:DUF3558 domain-containing protein n=1 Tax=Amycolatopsis acidiphila TaxID=715473 RepID=A0A558A9U1_9PSEU|nr:DUF3558 domain-containing protein [Amycolatopsis acidiphila]TVT21014.1 DUF3558 domain-containing protein [Amycolatopsis acidiphila]UIJ61325.1 DUF3558 domain-containing protein [Amycolatopsis acidiphila]GHG78205.1 hypothetical protein GCM10017788_45140 [Amycolatopsis acidiphila]
MPVLLLAVLLTTACGPDLSRQNFPRTTVTASAAPDSPITDDAVSFANLRTVDPCALLDTATLADLGTVKADSTDSSSLGQCSADLTDAGGKDLRLHLQLDDITINSGNTSGTVGGLPLIGDGPDGASCTATAVTSRSPGFGVSLYVTYDGGDPCGAGQNALQNVVRRLHDHPARLPQPPGSLIALDFCTLVDEATITDVLGRGSETSPYGMHGCSWSGGTATGYLDYGIRSTPGGSPAVDLGNGVTGYEQLETGAGRECTVSWLHRPTADGEGEVVSFQYDNYHDDAGEDDACGKAATVAKALVPKLPRA